MISAYPGEEKFAQVNGTRVCYLDEGTGEPLLFIHGLGGSINNWAPNIEFFKRYYRVIALDLPGSGKSPYAEADYDIEFFADTIRGLLSSLGIDRANVVGNSLGGLITLHLALLHPDTVENVVLVDPVGGHDFPEMLKWAVRRLPPRWLKRLILFLFSYLVRYRAFYRMVGIYQINRYTQVLIDEAVGTAERPDLEDYLEAYVRTVHTALNVSYADRLGDIYKPVLIVWGQKDIGLHLSVGHSLNKSIKGSFLVAVPRAAHVPQLDQPEIFNAAVSRFLAGSGSRDR